MSYSKNSDLAPLVGPIPYDNPLAMKLWTLLPNIDAILRGCLDAGYKDSYYYVRGYLIVKAKIKVSIVVLKTYITRYHYYQMVASKNYIIAKEMATKRNLEKEAEITKADPVAYSAQIKIDPCFVYFIHCEQTSMVKIGYSRNPKERMKSIGLTSPTHLILLKAVPGSPEYESELHNQFAHLRQRGEWFAAESELLDFIASLPSEEPANA